MYKKVAVFGIPTHVGQAHQGARWGPAALRKAGLLERLRLTGTPVADYGDIQLDSYIEAITADDGPIHNFQSVVQVSDLVFTKLSANWVPNDQLLLALGGDHSISIGTIAAVANRYANLGVIWFDAHPDMNTVETSPSGNAHGMALAANLGVGHPLLVQVGGFRPKLRPENVVIIGARSIDSGEQRLIHQLGVRCYTMADIHRDGIEKIISESLAYLRSRVDAIHLSFDVDVLDPEIAPGVAIPVAQGISLRECTTAFLRLNQSGMIVSLDVVELNPLLDHNSKTAVSTAALVSLLCTPHEMLKLA